MSINSLTSYNPLSINGLDTVNINGNPFDPSTLVPYNYATSTVDLNSQNIKTTYAPTASSDLTNKNYVDNQDATKASLAGNNTFSGTNSFSNTVSMTSISTATSAYTLGLNGSNQIVKYVPPTWIGGSVTTGYIPYSSSANILANSYLFQNGSDLGFGTISPADNFHIKFISATQRIESTSGNASLKLQTTGSTSLLKTDSTGDLYIDTGTSSKKIILQGDGGVGGYVGIGSLSPVGLLQLYSTNASVADRLTSLIINTYRAGIRLTSNGTAGCDWNFWVSTAGESPPQDSLCFYNQGTSKFRMVLTRDGNLGVGVDAPSYKLQVAGTGIFGYIAGSKKGILIANEDSYGTTPCIQGVSSSLGTNDISINPSGGNVAIGRIAPSYKLHVEGTIAGQSFFSLFPTLNGGAGSNVNMTAGNGAFGSIEAYNTANTAKLPLCLNAYGGLVTIGTTDPQGNKLIVSGGNSVSGISLGDYTTTALKYIGITRLNDGTNTATDSGFSGITFGAPNDGGGTEGYLGFHTHDYGGSSGERVRITKTGLVGIGTTTPSYKLDVAGNMRVTAGDNSRCVYGPNSTWGATLIVGSGPEVSGYLTAGITATNGNLHLDAGDGYSMYYGFYANSHGTPNQHLFYGGNYAYDSMPQNTGEYAQVCVMQGNRMLRSQAVAHQVVVNASIAWGGGANYTYAFYRYNGYTSQMIIGRLSYYQTGSAMAYYTIRIYSQSTGQVWYFPLNSFTNVANNHITVPIYAIFTSGYTTATGWFDIYVYNAGNCVTDGNDILDLHVITLPASNF